MNSKFKNSEFRNTTENFTQDLHKELLIKNMEDWFQLANMGCTCNRPPDKMENCFPFF